MVDQAAGDEPEPEDLAIVREVVSREWRRDATLIGRLKATRYEAELQTGSAEHTVPLQTEEGKSKSIYIRYAAELLMLGAIEERSGWRSREEKKEMEERREQIDTC